MFNSITEIEHDTWQAFERNVCRLLVLQGYKNVRLVGQSSDHGADVLATTPAGKRALVQVKHWARPVGRDVVDRTIEACRLYEADIPIIASLKGFDRAAQDSAEKLRNAIHVPIQLWSAAKLVELAARLPIEYSDSGFRLREYQKDAIDKVVSCYNSGRLHRALVVLATGLGKTVVAAESLKRIRLVNPGLKVLVCAHTNPLVRQLERAFWRFIKKTDTTIVWNSNEQHSIESLRLADFTFACVDSVAGAIKRGVELPNYDIILVDECHHVGGETYATVLNEFDAGKSGGSFLIGLTATPWRADDAEPRSYFGDAIACVDMVEGLQKGFLANVDYRMFTSNIDWSALAKPNSLQGENKTFTPKQLNKTIFIKEWNDAVVYRLRDAFAEQRNPRAIVFCATIDHAIMMRDIINRLKFCRAEALYSGGGYGRDKQSDFDRNRILVDFADGRVGVVCAVDIFNEGIDVPDVNIIVFDRTTHSRRIFIQQLGRGLRIANDKEKVIVLDFVSDVRRIAQGISLKKHVVEAPTLVSVGHKVSFCRAGGESDPQQESFLRAWLDQAGEISDAGENDSFLKFPPIYRPNSF